MTHRFHSGNAISHRQKNLALPKWNGHCQTRTKIRTTKIRRSDRARATFHLPARPSSAKFKRHHVHARLAKHAEVAAACVLLDEFANAVFGNSARLGHARNLDFRVRHADVRVEAAGGCRHGVGGHRRVCREAVVGTVGGDVCVMLATRLDEVGPRLLPLELVAS